MNKGVLKRKISKKLAQLEEIIEQVRNVDIQPDDPETWDPDYYSELQTNLEKSLEFLKGQIVKDKQDEFGDPIILEAGICSLIDEYQGEEEEAEDNE